jgi:dihydropteroate synthase
MDNQIFRKKRYMKIDGKLLDLSKPLIMGILNVTEDSFYDGGRYTSMDRAIEHTARMVDEGADFIDIGGQSTRPGASMLPAEKELKSLLPLIQEIKKCFPQVKLSIDTFYAKVAEQCIDYGAVMINDISGGKFDAGMFDLVAKKNIPYVLMHTGGMPGTMQNKPHYDNVVAEVIKFLSQQVSILEQKGLSDIIIDPGFGFGKTLEHNYQLLNALKHFSFLEKPILVGLSRKSMIHKVLESSAEDALNGTSVMHTIALLKGADFIRVHDVKEAREVVKLVEAFKHNGDEIGIS